MTRMATSTQELKISKFSCTWIINNFSRRRQVLESPIFSVESDCKLKWSLLVYPTSTVEDCKDYVSLFLKLVSCSKSKVETKIRFAILNEKLQEIRATTTHRVFTQDGENSYDWGFKKFVEREFLLNESNKVLPDDDLTIFCEVILKPDNLANQSNVTQFEVPNCHLADDLGKLFETQKFSDVTLSVDEREFLAHKAILASRSPVLAAMFEHELEEKKQNRVIIKDIDQDVLEEMLRFIYTGKADNLKKMANDLLAAADKYDIERLKTMCEDMLCNKLSVENAADTLILADLHSAEHLKRHAIDFIKRHAKKIIDTSGWKTNILAHPHLMAEVFKALVEE